MDFKTFKLMVFHGFLRRRVFLRAFMFTVALSVVPLLQMSTGACFYVKVWGSFGSVQLENATCYFEQNWLLPADCRSMTKTKTVLDKIEPLSEKKPVGFGKTIAYLPEFVNLSYKQRLVYIEIGASEHLNSDVTDWFLPSYPLDRNAFDVYFVDHNTSVMLHYVNKPGINFVYYPSLAGIGVTSIDSYDIDDDSDPFVEDEGFDFLVWIKETVRYADFVVLKMNAGAAGMKILSDLFESGTICFVDELFLHCSSDKIENGGVKGDCMGLFKALRTTGVYVHQWWGD